MTPLAKVALDSPTALKHLSIPIPVLGGQPSRSWKGLTLHMATRKLHMTHCKVMSGPVDIYYGQDTRAKADFEAFSFIQSLHPFFCYLSSIIVSTDHPHAQMELLE